MDSAADRAAAGATAGPSGGVSNKRPAQQQQQQQQPPPHITQASRRTKKNGRGGRRTNQQQSRSNGADANAAGAAGGAAANNNDDLVRVVPVPPDSVLLQEVRMGERKAEREREKEVKSFRLDRRHIFFFSKKKKKKKNEQDGWRPVRLSATDHAPQARVDPETGTLASTKGYCTARGTHGASEGTWYYEVELTSLGGRAAASASSATAAGPSSTSSPAYSASPSSYYLGAARVGWATRAAELQAPVGYDKHGYAFRDREGCKVHDALREPYLEEMEEEEEKKARDGGGGGAAAAAAAGEEEGQGKKSPPVPPLPAVKQGDVIGCYLHLPPGGRPLERTKEDIVSWKGGLYFVDRPEAPAAPVRGSAVAFYLNGRGLGVAFADILEGTYYPAGSLFTPPPPRGRGGVGGGALAGGAAATSEAEKKKKEGEKEKEAAAAAATTPLGLGKRKAVSFGAFDAVASFNFGPRFRFPPSEPPREGLPEARPACEMAGPPP